MCKPLPRKQGGKHTVILLKSTFLKFSLAQNNHAVFGNIFVLR
jgi:hypothetical protein